jgi:hypothetical protein
MAPCGTRNQAVVVFEKDIRMIPVISTWTEIWPKAVNYLSVYAVSAGRHSIVDTEKSICSIEIRFWAREGCPLKSGRRDKSRPSYVMSILAPGWWTPKIYLAALFHKLDGEKSIWLTHLSSFSCVDQPFDSIIDVHWLYGCRADELQNKLSTSGALDKIDGGDMVARN